MDEYMTDDQVHAEALALLATTDEVEALIAEKTKELDEYTKQQRESRALAQRTLLLMSSTRGGVYKLTMEEWFDPSVGSRGRDGRMHLDRRDHSVTTMFRGIKTLSLDDAWAEYEGLYDMLRNKSNREPQQIDFTLELPDGRLLDMSQFNTLNEVKHVANKLPAALKDGAL